MSATLQQRVVGILSNPQSEWPVIAAEPETVQGLYTRYIMILAAIGPIVLILRVFMFGVIAGVMQYVLGLVGVFVCAVLIAWLGPRFRSSGDHLQALKLVAYAETPVWIGSIANLIPMLGTLVMLLAAIYSIYLFYLGVGPVMKTPDDQRIPYMLVSAILIIVVSIIFVTLLGLLGVGTAIGLGRLF